MPAPEHHRITKVRWLRAAVMGANDGIVSTASLVIGVAAAHAARQDILLAGVAGLAAGAFSMAAGEYVSVSSQADTEQADLALERKALASKPEEEEQELAAIYQSRGLEPELALTVARQFMKHDALGAHARDELGFTEELAARPVMAAVASALTFAVGALLPLAIAVLVPRPSLPYSVAAGSLACLAVMGALAGRAGGASPWIGALRVAFWSSLAMAATAGVGALFGAGVG